MKLKEIYDSPVSIGMSKTPTKMTGHYNISALKNKLGSGSFGYVKNHPIDAHLVSKRSIQDEKLENDAYFQYAQYVVKHDLAASNFHFPRIYNIVVTPTLNAPDSYRNRNLEIGTKDMFGAPSGLHLYRVDMEKLMGCNDVNAEEMEALIRYTLADDMVPEEFYTADTRRLYVEFILTPMHKYYIHQTDSAVFKDKKLIEAMDTVMEIVDKHNYGNERSFHTFWLDTKASNYLFRRINTGLQIVFNDPLA